MQLLTAEALLLDVMDLQERDRIVTLLTAAHGKVRGVARGARRKYSRFAGQLQPLAKVRVTWFEKEGRELARISDVALLRPARPLQASLEGILLGSYLADHCLQFAQENEESDHLYRLLDSTVQALLDGADRELAARYFETWVLRLAGIFPPPRECPSCGRELAAGEAARLAPSEDALICADCAAEAPGGAAVTPGALDFLRRSARESLPRMGERPPPPAVLAEVEALCGRIRRAFLGHELKSYGVIRRTLGELED